MNIVYFDNSIINPKSTKGKQIKITGDEADNMSGRKRKVISQKFCLVEANTLSDRFQLFEKRKSAYL